MKKYLFISLITLLAGCASNQPTADSQDNSINDSNSADLALSTDTEFNALWKVQKRVDPGYSMDGARKGLSGCVKVMFVVNSEGKATEPEIIDSFPAGVFNKQAIEAISQWRWQPTAANAERAPAPTDVKFDFLIQGTQNKAAAEKHCDITVPSF